MRSSNQINNGINKSINTTQRKMKPLKQDNRTPIINDTFNASEAYGVIRDLIDNQIKFYKLQHLSHWVGDHSTTRDFYGEKIVALEATKAKLLKTINEAKEQGCELHIDGFLDLKLVK